VTTLVKQLRQLLIDRSQRESIGRAARQRAESNFNSQRNAARVVEILAEVSDGPN
jgi:glycosyltransferase involved in cell wall biosynthesis